MIQLSEREYNYIYKKQIPCNICMNIRKREDKVTGKVVYCPFCVRETKRFERMQEEQKEQIMNNNNESPHNEIL